MFCVRILNFYRLKNDKTYITYMFPISYSAYLLDLYDYFSLVLKLKSFGVIINPLVC